MTPDLGHFRAHGYQVVRGLLPLPVVDCIRDFLAAETTASLSEVQEEAGFSAVDTVIETTRQLIADKSRFSQLSQTAKQALSGHFRLAARLHPILLEIPKLPAVQTLMCAALEVDHLRMHMPPTARFVLPGNEFAAVPPHQDVSYNKQVSRFAVMWVPLVDIDARCGGVVVHHGSGGCPEQLATDQQAERQQFWLGGIEDGGYEKVHCEMNAGDVLLLNQWIIHQSAANQSAATRYSIDYRFFGGDETSLKHYLDLQHWQVVAPLDERKA